MDEVRLPWETMESYQTAGQLYRLVNRIAKRSRKQLPATAYRLRSAASGIGGKLGRSCVPFAGSTRRLLDRSRALRRARYVQRTLRRVEQLRRTRDPEIGAALEVVERVILLIETGR